MLPTPTELEYFAETFRTKHISKAAIRLGVTQPTLTQSLQKLEEKLGSKLFHRTRQGLIPTEEGSLFFVKAHTLLDSWREVSEGVQVSRTEIQGRFRVGCHQSVGAYTLPSLLKNINESAPRIELSLIHDFSRKVTEGIISYQIDLGYVVNPMKHPDLVLKKIGDDRVMFWKKRGLSQIPKRIFADVDQAQIEGRLGKAYKGFFKDWGLAQSSSLELIRTLTLSGQGIGILPERVAKADGAALVVYDESLPIRKDEIYLAYRKEVLSSKAGKELIRLASIAL